MTYIIGCKVVLVSSVGILCLRTRRGVGSPPRADPGSTLAPQVIISSKSSLINDIQTIDIVIFDGLSNDYTDRQLRAVTDQL